MKFKLDITIEPVIFLLALSNGFSTNGQVNLIMQKLCDTDAVHHNITSENPEYCQQRSTEIGTLKAMLKECLPAIPLLVAGSWRDKHGKNIPVLIVTITGQILGALVCLLSSVFWKSMSIMVTVLFEALVTGLTGGLPLLLMTSACFIATRTSIEDRTFRMSFILAAYLGGITFGLILSGIILTQGFILLYSLAFILAIISLLYICLFINETPIPSKESLPIWLLFKLLVKKREKNARPIIFLMAVIHCLFGSTLLCEANIFFFFLQQSLKLSAAVSGLYSAYRSIMLTLSTFIVIPVLSKYFKMGDILLGTISAATILAGSVWAAFARTKLQLALYPLADLMKGAVYAVDKSIMTKCVGPNEIGQVMSAIFVIEACFHLLLLPLYTYVYNETREVFPGAFFIISAVGSLIIFFSFRIASVLTMKGNKKTDEEEVIPDDVSSYSIHEPAVENATL